jgi:hypothetical protein
LIGSAEETVPARAGIVSDGVDAQITDDDVSLVWLSSQNENKTAAGVSALLQSQANGNPARIQTVLYGSGLQAQLGNAATDPRTPNIVIQPIPGSIYS